jgi:hypothetical protein
MPNPLHPRSIPHLRDYSLTKNPVEKRGQIAHRFVGLSRSSRILKYQDSLIKRHWIRNKELNHYSLRKSD